MDGVDPAVRDVVDVIERLRVLPALLVRTPDGRIVASSATPEFVTASSSPYIDASRTPRPDGTNTTSTATIAPIADTPPRNGSVAQPGSPPRLRTSR